MTLINTNGMFDFSSGPGGRGKSKHHVMLCKTHVTCGTCPYESRCQYIHDDRLDSSTLLHVRSTKSDSECQGVKDCFYWPHAQEGAGRSRYNVSNMCDRKYAMHHRAVFSMWHHFLAYCGKNAFNNHALQALQNEENEVNLFTDRPRLPVFSSLSQGKSLVQSKKSDTAVPDAISGTISKISSPSTSVLSGFAPEYIPSPPAVWTINNSNFGDFGSGSYPHLASGASSKKENTNISNISIHNQFPSVEVAHLGAGGKVSDGGLSPYVQYHALSRSENNAFNASSPVGVHRHRLAL